MSTTSDTSTKQGESSGAVPAWIAAGLLGLAIGIGGTVLTMQGLGYTTEKHELTPASKASGPSPSPSPAGGGGAPPAMGLGGGGMGGMMGGGGGAPGKRNLTSLVGKLELLSRPSLNLHVELSAEQAKSIAAKLAELDKSEKMTADEADEHLAALEELLTPEQKETLGLVGLPFGRPGGGAAGRPGAGAPGSGAPAPGAPGSGAPGAGGPPGGSPDANPFAQETNQKRLRDLLGRLAPGSNEAPAPSKGAAPPKSTTPAAEEKKGDGEKK